MTKEEKLKEAKMLYQTANADQKYVLESLFPELKESEDERIRKEIVDFICWATDRGCITKEQREKSNSWLAWLAKQGETFTKKDVDDAYLKGVCGAKQELKKQGEQKHQYISRPRYIGEEELLGEQKPVESSKDYHSIDPNFGISVEDLMTKKNTDNKAEPKFKVKYAGNEYNVLEVKDIGGITFYGIEDEPNHIDYVKAENCEIISGYAIKETGSPYPTNHAEWSDEDSEHLDSIIESYKDLLKDYKACHDVDYIPYNSDTVIRNVVDDVIFLKSIKDRVYPKAELTQLDKNILEAAIAFVEQNNHFNYWSGVSKHTVLSALYSLRPKNIVTDEELAQAKKEAYNDALDKIEYHSGEPTFDDGWSSAIWYMKMRNAQPQYTWGPSEEHIKVLNEVLNFAANHESPHWNDYIFETLNNFIRQLKKLKGQSYEI